MAIAVIVLVTASIVLLRFLRERRPILHIPTPPAQKETEKVPENDNGNDMVNKLVSSIKELKEQQQANNVKSMPDPGYIYPSAEETQEPKKAKMTVRTNKKRPKGRTSDAEKLAFRAAVQANSIEAYTRFLEKEYPTKNCRGMATRKLNALKSKVNV